MLIGLAAALFSVPLIARDSTSKPKPRWWKGNLHTHSLWSDGDDYPEMIARWYKQNGYHFLALSDHNILSQGQKWIEVTNNRGGTVALQKYEKEFGAWVERRNRNGQELVRLKPLNEFRAFFEEPGKFLLIQSEEITDKFGSLPIHLNATNLRDFIPPQGGTNVVDVMRRDVQAVLDQREATGQLMFPHLNHPNFGWAITAEQLAEVEKEKFFEVYNGHPSVHNEGDETRASTDRMWDIILAKRLSQPGGLVMYGVAVDDSHNYHTNAPNKSNPGRGWVMVRAPWLTPENIVSTMEAGDFYASSGVELLEIERSAETYRLKIKKRSGVKYVTQFIGTRRGADLKGQPILNKDGAPLPVTHRYSAQIGEVLAEVAGQSPSYRFRGDELYVRAKVISTRLKENPYRKGEVEMAWTQPALVQAK
ncbi:MAG: hypothetical protein AB1813_10320 [Verrucomicrobiota bacterium]